MLIKSHFPTFENFAKGMNPDICRKRYRDYNSLQKCQDGNIIKLWEIGKIYNKDSPILILEIWLHKLNDYINLQNEKKLDGYQIEELAEMLYERCYDMNLAELTLLFKKIKLGDYTQLYGSISGINIGQWFSRFMEEKRAVVVKLEEQKQLQENLTVNQRAKSLLSGLYEKCPDLKDEIKKAYKKWQL